MNHTPEPWQVEEVAQDAPEILRQCGLCVTYNGEDIAYISPCEESEHHANANLIAAAPDLLEALVGLYDLVSTQIASIPDAQYAKVTAAAAAIAKAEGRAP